MCFTDEAKMGQRVEYAFTTDTVTKKYCLHNSFNIFSAELIAIRTVRIYVSL